MTDEPKDCLPLEDVAAFAEGRLGGVERERVVEHLAACDDCRELLADTLQTTADVEAEAGAESGGASVVELRSRVAARGGRFGRRGLLTAVAAGLMVVGGWVIFQRFATPHPPSPREWLAEMPPAEQLAPHAWRGVTMRGPGATFDLARHSAELGALMVDLEVATAGGDATGSTDVLRRMATILDEAGMMEGDVQRLRAMAEHEDAASMREELQKGRAGLEERLRQRFTLFYLDLGAFAEEARLAALSGKADFLESRPTRRYLDWLLSQADEPLPPAVRDGVSDLQRASRGTTEEAAQAATALRDSLVP